jgi:5-methylcytosine-specific restriction endonuclease McrA
MKGNANAKGRKKPPSYSAKLSVRMKEYWADPERRAAYGAKVRAYFASPEARARLAERVRQDWANNPERKLAFVEALKNAPPKGPCFYCGAPAKTRDHKLPRSRGGTDAPENLVLACKSCNSSKGRLTAEEFLAARELRTHV